MESDVLKTTGFHPVTRSWFTSAYSEVSPPQSEGWPAIAEGNHTLIMAPTGSGKTLAAFLWSIDELLRRSLETDAARFELNISGVHTLYISPLKALNNDIERNLRIPLSGISAEARRRTVSPPSIRVAVRTGDTPSHIRQAMLRRPPHILITTPESLYLLITSERGRLLFRNLRYVIVDEIHALCGNKRGVHLSLSLERLSHLSANEPVRIGLSATQKPLGRIASFLGGQQYDARSKTYKPRPVTIVDCGQRRNLDLKVISPVPSFSELPERSVWPAVYSTLYKLISGHTSTLVFAGMRAQTEKIARELNELHRRTTGDPEAIIALAHHGSISRESRHEVETMLKEGRIPAVIATASLELGIDIGSIDLVVQLESPKSVSAALQRVGRSGHLLKATSKGRILPLYQTDLDDASALIRAMEEGAIEETGIPENPLDVLSQQILAEVSMQTWTCENLYLLIRQSYCYRNLSDTAFRQVIEMLVGHYAETPLRSLRPRLTWDRINDLLIARPGSRHAAVMNAGTIPDRAYYRVIRAGTNTAVGEVEEEFVFESRIGQNFFLGNNEWHIDDIRQDRIVVSPVADYKPKPPFWKGDLLYRDFSTSRKIGLFRESLIAHLDQGNARDWLISEYPVDASIAENLVRLFERQQQCTKQIATHRNIVLEWFTDPGGDSLVLIHAPLGARVNAPLAMILSATLKSHFHSEIQYTYDDDAILIRLPDSTENPPLERLLIRDIRELEELLLSSLPDTRIFAVHFRYNAARALLLARSRPGKRIPLWLQRLRAAELYQQVQSYPDFPLTVETYRECLFDIFDLPSLKQVLSQIQSGEIRIHSVETAAPSPMTTSLLYKFLAENLYELDRTRQTGETSATSGSLLNEILDQEHLPDIVTTEIIDEYERRWQYLDETCKARDAETLYAVIEQLGPVSTDELARRSVTHPQPWLDQLAGMNRITRLPGHPDDWIAAIQCGPFERPDTRETQLQRIARFLRSRGPVSFADITNRFTVPPEVIQSLLDQLRTDKLVVSGRLVRGSETILWCDRENYKTLYRSAIARRREHVRPVSAGALLPFMMRWHHINGSEVSVKDLLYQYRGFPFPPQFFEQEINVNRLSAMDPRSLSTHQTALSQQIANGEFIIQVLPGGEGARRHIRFIPRGDGHLFLDDDREIAGNLFSNETDATVYRFLRENGASFFRDLETALETGRLQLQNSLLRLFLQGLVTTDHYPNILHMLTTDYSGKREPGEAGIPEAPPWARQRQRPRRLKRSYMDAHIREAALRDEGRWLLVRSFAVMGKNMDPPEKALKQARILLHRYGILIKEWYRREQGLLPWYDLFQVLKRLEWQGEIERGYFIEGLSGIQFALPQAVSILSELHDPRQDSRVRPIWVSTADPALPLGGAIPWNLKDRAGHTIEITRSTGNHLLFRGGLPVAYSENYGRRIRLCAAFGDMDSEALPDAVKNWLKSPPGFVKRKRIEIERIDGHPAAEHELAGRFLTSGFEKEGTSLVLWPSGV